MPAAFSLPQEQIDSILRSGGGRDNSRKRIYAKYQQGKTPQDTVNLLLLQRKSSGHGILNTCFRCCDCANLFLKAREQA